MMTEKNVKTKAHCYMGVAVVLLLIAAVFVGSASAAAVLPGDDLANKIAKLSDGNVTVDLSTYGVDDIQLSKDNVKSIVKSMTDAFYLNTAVSKNLTITFGEKYISVGNDESHKVSISGENVKIERIVGSSLNETVLTGQSLSVDAIYGTDTLKYSEITSITADFKQNGYPQHISLNVIGGTLSVNTKDFGVDKITVDNQPIIVNLDQEAKTVSVSSYSDNDDLYGKESMTGSIKFNDGTIITGSNIGIIANGDYNAITAFGMVVEATVDISGGQSESGKVSLANVQGSYIHDAGIQKVNGTVKLESNDVKLAHVLPIPSFVDFVNLNLNGKTLSTDKTSYFDYRKSDFRVTVTSPGFIKKVGSGDDYTTQFKKADTYDGKTLKYRWSNPNWEFYVENGGSGGGGGGGGSSITPNYTPTVTPTPTQPWTPIDPSQTGVQPSQSPKSPMPVFGILAGLGAAALAGVVLRRK